MAIEYVEKKVTVKFGTEAAPRDVTKTYKQIDKSKVTVDDILAELQDEKKAQQLIKDWHYGQDLRAKSEVRNAIIASDSGPEKAFEKSVKDFMKLREANEKPVTEEQARKFITLSQSMDIA